MLFTTKPTYHQSHSKPTPCNTATMLYPRDANDDVLNFHFYYYHPSMAAAVIFVILFGVSTGAHFWQLLRSRTWFMIPFLIGGICTFLSSHAFRRLD